MRKLLAVCVLGLCLTAATFAEHPEGWGIGVSGSGGWTGGGVGSGTLLLKVPSIPVYWGLDFGGYNNWFWFSINGDYYLIDKTLVPDINLGWYAGLGGHLGFGGGSATIAFRFPIGLSWQLPIQSFINTFEVFLEVVPTIGLSIPINLYGGVGGALGLRVWF
ncbi:MAG: hypothetical protein LBO67_09290 [Spirochaetaceae bacterium]|jgi:hypothetical protein|nr:hypothetical protein [Spirochaetaceae bacterium]